MVIQYGTTRHDMVLDLYFNCSVHDFLKKLARHGIELYLFCLF
jgi:hypothetical protein